MAKIETYGIVKKGSYLVQKTVDGDWIHVVYMGAEVLAMLDRWRTAIAENLPAGVLTAPQLPHGAALSIHSAGSLRAAKGRPAVLTLCLTVCDLDLDTDPVCRDELAANGWRLPSEDDRYVRLYPAIGSKRPILCKTVTYTITRED